MQIGANPRFTLLMLNEMFSLVPLVSDRAHYVATEPTLLTGDEIKRGRRGERGHKRRENQNWQFFEDVT